MLVKCVESKIRLSSCRLLTVADAVLALLSIMDDADPICSTEIGPRELSGASGIMTYVAIASWRILWKGCSLQMSSHSYLLITCLVKD